MPPTPQPRAPGKLRFGIGIFVPPPPTTAPIPLALSGVIAINTRSSAARGGLTALAGSLKTQVESPAGMSAAAPLTAMEGGGGIQVKMRAGSLTTTSLTGAVATQAKARPAAQAGTALSGRVATQVEARVSQTSIAVLTARAIVQAKAVAAQAGTALLTARVVTVTGLNATRSALTALSGIIKTQAQLAPPTTQPILKGITDWLVRARRRGRR